MQPGDKVRVMANPGRIGILGNETDGPTGPRQRVLVTFLDGTEDFILPGSIEKVPNRPQGPFELIRSGRFGRVSDLRGLTTYYRLSGKLANLIYSLNTTNTEFYAYQFKPVLQFLDSPSNSILIADEVGLGKTIEAGLIWTELRARQDARRLLVVCPAMLREKWRDELANRFGVKAEIVDAGELLEGLQEVQQRPLDGFAYIASVQGLRPPRGWDDDDPEKRPNTATAQLAQFLDSKDQVGAPFDLIIVDEAHYLRNTKTQTYKLGKLLRDAAQSMVMLSATPIQLHNQDLFNLVHLLDEEAFPYLYSFERTLAANAPLVELRDKVLGSVITQEEFKATLDSALWMQFYDRSEQFRHLRENPPNDATLSSYRGRAEIADQLDRINPLGKIITRTLKRDVQEHRVERDPHVIRARMSAVEAAFYEQVTDAVRSYCEDLDIREGFMLTIPQRQMSSCMPAACIGWKQDRSAMDMAEMQELLYEIDPELEQFTPASTSGLLLKRLNDIAHQIGDQQALMRSDSKFAVLRSSLRDYWKQHPGRKVVLFSFYKKTLYYLCKRLEEEGIAAIVVHGGMDKQRKIEEFRSTTGPDILLSSEVAAEGVDLQFSSLLINYDLPWNPAKIEQRIGRIDRIGQQADRILIWNLVYEDTIDDRVYERLFERLNLFRYALGSMEAILGEEIRTLSHDLLSHKLTPEQEQARIDRAKVAIETLSRRQTQLEEQSANLIAHGEYIQNKVRAANELGRYIRGDDLLAYVVDFLQRHYPGTRILTAPSDRQLRSLELSVDARIDLDTFINEQRLYGKTALLAARPPRLRFDNKLQRTKPGVEVVSQDHPLVRFVAARIRQLGGDTGYMMVSAVQCKAELLPSFQPGVYVYLVMRWSFSGTREIERLEYFAISLDTGRKIDGAEAERLVSTAALAGTDWLDAPGSLDLERTAKLQDECRAELEERFRDFSANQKREDTDYLQHMVTMQEKQLANKREKAMERILRHRESKNPKRQSLISAEEGKLKNEERRINECIEQYQRRNAITQSQDSPVSSGTIRVI